MTTAHQRKEQAALASVAASGLLTIGKLVAGLLSGSLGLISEAGHGAVDTASTSVTYFAVKAAGKPADEEHHYGHAKMEAVAALVQTGLLLVLAVVVVVAALHRLMTASSDVEATWVAFAVLFVSIGVDFVRWRGLSRIAAETGSHALAADALHFSSDLVSSVLVLCGLVATRFGFPQGDAVAALGVAVFIGFAGYRLGRETIDTLVDAAPTGLAGRLRAIVSRVPGVQGVEQLRLRPSGAEVLGELSIAVARTLPLDKVSAIKGDVAAAIAADMPRSAVTVIANPRALDDETVLEKVLLVSAMRRVPVHHVTVQEVDGRKSVSLDVELDGRMRHGDAHEIASALETEIRQELGPQIEVETHIEPLEVRELAGRDCGAGRSGQIDAALARLAAQDGVLSQIHNVRVRETAAGLVVNYHCRVDPSLSVDQVHEAVDRLDHWLRQDVPSIARVVGHAEPLRL